MEVHPPYPRELVMTAGDFRHVAEIPYLQFVNKRRGLINMNWQPGIDSVIHVNGNRSIGVAGLRVWDDLHICKSFPAEYLSISITRTSSVVTNNDDSTQSWCSSYTIRETLTNPHHLRHPTTAYMSKLNECWLIPHKHFLHGDCNSIE